MIVNRLFRVARSYLNDYIEKKEDEYGFDNEEEKREFQEWKRQQYEKYEKRYDRYSQSGSGSGRKKKKKEVSKEEQYFKNLELEPTKDFTVIKKQYRKLMKKYHPDRYNNDEDMRKTAEKITSKLNEAYAFFQDKYEK